MNINTQYDFLSDSKNFQNIFNDFRQRGGQAIPVPIGNFAPLGRNTDIKTATKRIDIVLAAREKALKMSIEIQKEERKATLASFRAEALKILQREALANIPTSTEPLPERKVQRRRAPPAANQANGEQAQVDQPDLPNPVDNLAGQMQNLHANSPQNNPIPQPAQSDGKDAKSNSQSSSPQSPPQQVDPFNPFNVPVAHQLEGYNVRDIIVELKQLPHTSETMDCAIPHCHSGNRHGTMMTFPHHEFRQQPNHCPHHIHQGCLGSLIIGTSSATVKCPLCRKAWIRFDYSSPGEIGNWHVPNPDHESSSSVAS
jgi:hypothetical protein